MFPCTAINDQTDKNVGHSVPFGQCVGQATAVFGAYFANLVVRQFGVAKAFSASVCAVFCGICLIGLWGVPSKVAQAVVGGTAVREVATLHPLRAHSDERFKNNPVHGSGVLLGIAARQRDIEVVPAFVLSARSHLSPFRPQWPLTVYGTTAPNRTVVADAVAGEALDVAVSNRSFGFSHDVNLLNRLALRSEPHVVTTPRRLVLLYGQT